MVRLIGKITRRQGERLIMEIYDQINEDIAGEYYRSNYPNNGQRFLAWYLRNIHNLDPIEARDV